MSANANLVAISERPQVLYFREFVLKLVDTSSHVLGPPSTITTLNYETNLLREHQWARDEDRVEEITESELLFVYFGRLANEPGPTPSLSFSLGTNLLCATASMSIERLSMRGEDRFRELALDIYQDLLIFSMKTCSFVFGEEISVDPDLGFCSAISTVVLQPGMKWFFVPPNSCAELHRTWRSSGYTATRKSGLISFERT